MTSYKRKVSELDLHHGEQPLKKQKRRIAPHARISSADSPSTRYLKEETKLVECITDSSSQDSNLSKDGDESSNNSVLEEFIRPHSRISLTCSSNKSAIEELLFSSSSRDTIEEFSSGNEENCLNEAMLLEESIEDGSNSSSVREIGGRGTDIAAEKSGVCADESDHQTRNNQTILSKASLSKNLSNKGKVITFNHSGLCGTKALLESCLTLSHVNDTPIPNPAVNLNNALIAESSFENCSVSVVVEGPGKSNNKCKESIPIINDSRKKGRENQNQEACLKSKEDYYLGYKEDQEIPFKWMLCNKNFWEKVPLHNIFNKLPKDDGAVEIILEDILKMNTGIYVPEITAKVLMNIKELVSIIKRIIQQWKKLSLPHLADHYCSYVLIDRSKDYTSPDKCVFRPKNVLQLMVCASPGGKELSLPGTPITEEELLTQEMGNLQPKSKDDIAPLGWRQVYALLLTVLQKVVPPELWGSSHNKKMMFKVVKTILKLGCHDKLFIGQVANRIKHKHFKWALKLRKYCHYTYLIGKVWIWIIKRLILTVISTLFYVTETTVRRNQLLYYRKRLWQSVHTKGIKKLIETKFCSFIPHSEVRHLIMAGGAAKDIPILRFLPKSHGVRPIIPAGMCGLSKLSGLYCRLLLREMLKPYECGSWEVRALSALHSSWLKYMKRVYLTGDQKPFYFVRVDVQDAYGSISHDTLIALIQKGVSQLPSILKFGCYTTLQYSKKSRPYKSFILLDEDGMPTRPLMRGGLPLVQCGEPFKIYPQRLLPSLLQTTTLQIAKVTSRQWVRVNRGVPQGGSLSGVLCELYYSAMCALHLVNFNKGDSIILRSVDDFLYITPSSSQAQDFLDRMRKGFPDFNCHINERKTVHNLQSGCGQRVAFRGIVVCSASRQILVDGASIATGLPRYSLRLNQFKSPGQLVFLRLKQVSLARLPLVVIDSAYTKPAGLVANIWRAGFMAGARLISLIVNFLGPQGSVNTPFIAKSVARVGGFVCARIKNVWGRGGRALPFVQQVINVVYVSAICAVLRMPSNPSFPMLYSRLKSYVKRLLTCIPREQYCYLPKLPRFVICP